MQNEERLNRIEERIAWLQRHVLEQDKVMLELAEENARLKKEVAALTSRLAGGPLDAGQPRESGSDERPPHY